MKKVLITGATGFIGSQLVNTLLNNGDDVWITTRNENVETNVNKENIFVCDLTNNKVNFGHYNVVINCSGILDSNEIWGDLSRNNCSTIENIIRNVSCEKFIHLSSCSVFSNEYIGSKQNIQKKLYGLSKHVSEKIFEIYSHKFPASITIRFPIVLGYKKIYSDIIKYIYTESKNNKGIHLFGNGDFYRNVIHITEAISAIIAAINNKSIFGYHAINAGSINSLKIVEYCKFIINYNNSQSKIKYKTNDEFTNSHSLIDISGCSKINYDCKSAEYNLNEYLCEMDSNMVIGCL